MEKKNDIDLPPDYEISYPGSIWKELSKACAEAGLISTKEDTDDNAQ